MKYLSQLFNAAQLIIIGLVVFGPEPIWAVRLVYALAALSAVLYVGASVSVKVRQGIAQLPSWRLKVSTMVDLFSAVMLVMGGYWWCAIALGLAASITYHASRGK